MASVSQTSRPVQRKPARPTHGLCGLVLLINGTRYGVRPLPTDGFEDIRAFRLVKRSAKGEVYDVAETIHGHTCDCPDFTFNRDGRDPSGCKHIKAAVACGL